MAGPMPGLLTLMEELYGRINKERLFGGGVRGAATRGLLGAQPAEDMTPTQRDVYENAIRISAPAQGLTALKAATVFHGSPAKFKRFDPTKIGSGEGAQVYGYGHYVAENPKVAEDYRKRLAGATDPYTYTWQNQQFEGGVKGDPVSHALGLTYHHGKSEAARIAKQGLQDAKAGEAYALDMGGVDYYTKMLETAKQLNKKDIKAAQGSFYKIDLPDEQIARMLDWDKPLSQQPENVRQALQKFGVSDNQKKLSEFDDALLSALIGSGPTTLPKQPLSQTGESFYKTLGNPSVASQRLREAGIPGIRYFDQGSRRAGQGTSNFVVFPGEEELLRILERNGVPITSLLD